jgi:hypothetical protein
MEHVYSRSRRRVMCQKQKVRAVVVLPVGLKANLSLIWDGSMADLSHRLTTCFSAIRQMMGVTDKGRNSLMAFGRETFGTAETIMDDNHLQAIYRMKKIS